MRFVTTLVAMLFSIAVPLFGQNAERYPVRFEFGTEYFPENYSEASKQLPNSDEVVKGVYHRYVQFSTIPNAPQRAFIEDKGATFMHYVNYGTYLMAIPKDFDLGVLSALDARSILPVNPNWKIARSLREQPYGEWAVNGKLVDINLQLFPVVSIKEGAELCRDAGIQVLQEGRYNGFLRIRVSEEKIGYVASLPFVQYIELKEAPAVKEDINGISIHRSSILDVAVDGGLKLNGEGVTQQVRDDGVVGPHIDFKNRIHNISIDAATNETHGDGVGGIMGGAGNRNPDNKGMAAGSFLYVTDYEANFQDTTVGLIQNFDVSITNSSYSNGCNAGYTFATQSVDMQINELFGIMHVFSAGNSNNLDCGYGAGNQWGNITGGHKVGKNCIATANLNANMGLVSSSSRGPAHDGRLKPDIAAHGQGQISTLHDNDYQTFGGTSAAAPGIAGCLAQLTQGYKDKHGEQPSSALLKAAILNTASEMGNIGPDYRFGWGHINNYRAWKLLDAENYLKDEIDNGSQNTHSLDIPEGTRYVKVMIYWHERQAGLNTSMALINDLDLLMTGPDGSIHQPWLLDPTPSPAILNTPAGKGRDSLNNMEQVAIVDPVAGTYTIDVNGFEVPMGPQEYFIVWEFYGDEVDLTYPAGGEGIVGGETARVYWDAYGNSGDFELKYSPDNGDTWLDMGLVSGGNRRFDWDVPNIASGKVWVSITRGTESDTCQFPITIAPLPTNVEVSRVCPDSLTLSYSLPTDTLSFAGFNLGEKYMEIVGYSDTTELSFPIGLPQAERWLAVAVGNQDGMLGRRTNAIFYPGGLKNCPQDQDLAVEGVLSPNTEQLIACDDVTSIVSVEVMNDGQFAVNGATISYQYDQNPVVTEALPNIPPGQSIVFQFFAPLTFDENGEKPLSVWTTNIDEGNLSNDTLELELNVVVEATVEPYTASFDGTEYLPSGWVVSNPDNSTTWVQSSGVTSPNGGPTQALWIDCYNYPDEGQEDYLYLPPFNLDSLGEIGIIFHLAHAQYNSAYEEGLRVEAFPNCDLTQAPVVLWEKTGPDLATTNSTIGEFFPNSINDWRDEFVGLDSLEGVSTAIIRFTSVNAYGNNIFLENIGLLEIVPPVGSFEFAADTICRGDTVSIVSTTPGEFLQHQWSFGTLSIPNIALGAGPHDVRFLQPGNRTVSMIVSNAFGSDTVTNTIYVRNFPTANFTADANGQVIEFTNTGNNADTYLWDFGDGNTSTEENPTHTYDMPGTYLVTLSVESECGDDVEADSVSTTVAVTGLELVPMIRVFPNPTVQDFTLEIEASSGTDITVVMHDASGKQVHERNVRLVQGLNNIPFRSLDLPSGVYPITIHTDSGSTAVSIVIE